MPRIWQSTATRSSALARASISRVVAVISRSKSAISDIRLSSRRREPSGSSRPARNSRPALPNRSECSGRIPWRANRACTRFLAAVRILVSTARWRRLGDEHSEAPT